MRYDAAWISLRDPETGRHIPLVQDGPTEALRAYFSTDGADAEVQRLGLHRFGWPMPAHRLPVPLEETLACGKYLLPAGFRDGLAVGVFTEDGRHLGSINLLTSQKRVVTATAAALLHTVNSFGRRCRRPNADGRRGGGTMTGKVITETLTARATDITADSRYARSSSRVQ